VDYARDVWAAALIGLILAAGAAPARAAETDNQNEDQVVSLVIGLLGEKDKDLRAVGLEQVRTEAKGKAATERFAAQLPKLSADAQVSLVSALADRKDAAALPAVLELLAKSPTEAVRIAAIGAVGSLGGKDELPGLLTPLESHSKEESSAARAAILQLKGDDVPQAIAATLANRALKRRPALIQILATRRALHAVPELLGAALDPARDVRQAAMLALGQMATEKDLPALLAAVLRAEPGAEREAAEKAVVLVCGRITPADQRDRPLLAAVAMRNAQEQATLLSTIGRVGGPQALAHLEKRIDGSDRALRGEALHALCEWPDASICDKLLAMVEKSRDPAERSQLLQAFVRCGGIRDKRTDPQRLERMQQAMPLAESKADRLAVISRCRTAYTVGALRFALPYLDQPEFAQQACETIVELAHHRELREPNKAEFDPALDKVIKISKDATIIDRAQRYKKGQTWVRPKPPEAS
jgi:HEAT repeat protein